ncbi:22636_t:CDS:1, partial [Racocetra persica]
HEKIIKHLPDNKYASTTQMHSPFALIMNIITNVANSTIVSTTEDIVREIHQIFANAECDNETKIRPNIH